MSPAHSINSTRDYRERRAVGPTAGSVVRVDGETYAEAALRWMENAAVLVSQQLV